VALTRQHSRRHDIWHARRFARHIRYAFRIENDGSDARKVRSA